MADLCYPVYRFKGYFKRSYLLYASRPSLALDFTLAYGTGASHGNGCYMAPSAPLPADAKLNNYRGWTIEFDYGYWTAISDDYDASYEGPEDGWIDNGLRLSERTLADLITEIDEHEHTKQA